jgi:cobalt-zinc-cadmium resistance protein CzcA
MNRELDKIPGVVWGFSQPIEDNMEEAVSGVKGELGHQGFRRRPEGSRRKGDEIVGVMSAISRGLRTWGCFACWASPT